MMHRTALLIGGNQDDRLALIEKATVLIRERIGTVACISAVYETEPWGNFEEAGEQGGRVEVRSFFNRALVVDTGLSPHEVLREALAIEKELGRRRPQPSPPNPQPSSRIYHSRPIDIDIIFYDDLVVDTPDLTIPHPRTHMRRFVLQPLAALIPDYRHPVSGRTVKELLSDL